ncbi:hypothetical protein B296_00033986 [Ensete ventricosum]|uniref:Uncharacterized protein n=1 Tax=Ensete ventricosum TaxID=4639 RepID=A0A427A869_ENSVE|nr:hypothetical protein B296_00033986 [Ensete ventricosum]
MARGLPRCCWPIVTMLGSSRGTACLLKRARGHPKIRLDHAWERSTSPRGALMTCRNLAQAINDEGFLAPTPLMLKLEI